MKEEKNTTSGKSYEKKFQLLLGYFIEIAE